MDEKAIYETYLKLKNKTHVAEKYGINRKVVRRIVNKFEGKPDGNAPKPRTIIDFKKRHDKGTIIPERIKTGIKNHLSKGWLYDAEFREACGVSVNHWRRYADEFPDYQTRVDGKLVWANIEMIDEIKEIVT